MNQKFLNQLAIVGIAGFNGVFVCPQIRKYYGRAFRINETATHYVSIILCLFDFHIYSIVLLRRRG